MMLMVMIVDINMCLVIMVIPGERDCLSVAMVTFGVKITEVYTLVITSKINNRFDADEEDRIIKLCKK